jgi:hypothetical protein
MDLLIKLLELNKEYTPFNNISVINKIWLIEFISMIIAIIIVYKIKLLK